MPPPWTLRKYRQISFFLEAGHNIDIDPEKYSLDKKYAKEIDDQLCGGVVYKDKKKKYWVDEDDQDYFAIYARALNITNGDDSTYWEWKPDSDGVETAMVKKTKWLEVRGSFWTMNLSANVDYEVSFLTRMEKTELPDMKGKEVNLRLITPDGSNIEGRKTLPEGESGAYYELKVGKFNMKAENVGKMEFVMDTSFKSWRAGLVIKGVEIKPV